MSQARLVDTHCHLDLFPDPAKVAREIESAGIYTLAVTNAPSVFERNLEIVRGCRFVRVAAGLHPELVHERESELPLLWRALEKTRYVGEVGLDYGNADIQARARQRKVFSSILEHCHRRGDAVITIHSRRAAEDVVEAIGTGFRSVPVLHWYSGSARILERALARGCYISVNTAMAANPNALRLVACAPKERVLTESDGPFVRVGQASAMPVHVESVITALAQLWHMTATEARQVVYDNFLQAIKDHRDRS